MQGRDLDAYDVLDCHSTVIPLFEETWIPSKGLGLRGLGFRDK